VRPAPGRPGRAACRSRSATPPGGRSGGAPGLALHGIYMHARPRKRPHTLRPRRRAARRHVLLRRAAGAEHPVRARQRRLLRLRQRQRRARHRGVLGAGAPPPSAAARPAARPASTAAPCHQPPAAALVHRPRGACCARAPALGPGRRGWRAERLLLPARAPAAPSPSPPGCPVRAIAHARRPRRRAALTRRAPRRRARNFSARTGAACPPRSWTTASATARAARTSARRRRARGASGPPCWRGARAPPVPGRRDERASAQGVRGARRSGRGPWRRRAGGALRARGLSCTAWCLLEAWDQSRAWWRTRPGRRACASVHVSMD
jgi:hypothetical protein